MEDREYEGFEEFLDSLDSHDDVGCSWCGGDGYVDKFDRGGFDDDLIEPDEIFPCAACGGSGLKKDQRLF